MFKRNYPALIGMLAGVLAVVLAVLLFTTPGNVVLNYNEQPSGISSMDTGTRTSYNYYGGDAYTGMQQAAAQAANNVLAMEETLRQTNNDLVAINENVKSINANIAALNNNISKILQAQADEQGSATAASVRTISQLGFFLLLAIGALTEVKYIGLLLDGIAESRKGKVTVAAPLTEAAVPAEETAQV